MFAAGMTWWHILQVQNWGIDEALAPLQEAMEPIQSAIGLETASTDGWGLMLVPAYAISLVMLGMAFWGRSALNKAKARPGVSQWYVLPGSAILVVCEMVVDFWRSMMGGSLERSDVNGFLPIVAGMFTYIFACNLMGMIPGFLPPTENVNHNWAMSISVFVLFVGVGLSRDAVSFIKHLLGPVLAMAPLIFAIEVIGLVVRPVTLTVRLTGNMFGDHTLFSAMSDLVPLGVPAVFLALALLVSFIQAFVFSLLTSIYIALSVPHHDEAH